MKIAINLVLALCAAGLLWFCYTSIQSPIQFQKDMAVREAAVKKRLVEIRTAEEQYRAQKGDFCDTLENLVEFVKNGRLPVVNKVGELTDEQMDKGLTEAKAAAIVRSGDAAAIEANGLQHFRRDTVWVPLIDTLYTKDFVADSLMYIPFSNGKKFDIMKSMIVNKSGTVQTVMECSAEYGTYLDGLNTREIANLRDRAEKTSRFPGLKIGDLYTANNNAGNWE